MKKLLSGFTWRDRAIVGMLFGILVVVVILTFTSDPATEDESAGMRSGPAIHRAVPAPGPSRQAVRAFVAEAKIDSCLPPDRAYTPETAVTFSPDHPCIKRPWTPDRQRRYCERRLDPGNPHIDYCSTVVPEWAYPTLLLTKLPQLIEYICNDDAEHLRKRYDEVIDAFYRAVHDRELAGLDRIYDEVYWPRTGEEIDC